MSPCHPFRPVPGQCGPNRRGPLPAPPFDPRDYWATRKFVSSLFESIETKIDKFDVVDPSAEAEAGQAADAKSTYEGLNRVLGVASDAQKLAESKADKAALDTHVASTSNPHAVTAEQINAYTKDDVETKLAKKADRATTLAGYGITDAATKTEIAAKADLVDGKVPAAQLPSYVDDVLEYDAVSAFPATGESSKIYVAKDTNLVYRWSGTQYVEISPSPAFDNTVTETSQNGVKSSGIWSWVKSLLPHWLTSDYAEPATVESVANKRDKGDLAVYSVTRTENTDWTWESENKELEAALNAEGIKIKFNDENTMWNAVADPSGWAFAPAPGTKSDLSVVMYFIKGPEWIDQYPATATRPRYMDETPGTAKQDQQIAAVATDDAAKPADGSLMKYDAANDRFVKAVEGTDYLKTHQDVANKRDKGDLAVYSGTRTENTDWTWTADNAELEAALSGKKPVFDEGYWWHPNVGGFRPHDPVEERSRDATEIVCTYEPESGDPGVYTATATRPRYMDETLGPAKPNQQLAAVATDDAAKPADGSLMKYDAANDRLVKAVEGTDYLKTHQDISGKFDATHDFDGESASLSWEAFYLAVYAPYGLYVLRGGMMADELDQHGQYVRTHSLFEKADRATTLSGYGITDGATKTELAAAVSTNNPAFVSAVQNTPAPEPGQGEDPPWGTWGTVGTAIAGLVAGLKWLKDKVFDSAGNIQDQFATDLLGKQVAKEKITASLADPFVAKASGSYSEGDPVTYDGKLYKRNSTTGDDTSWVSSHWTETTVATLWNNADTTSYGGQN